MAFYFFTEADKLNLQTQMAFGSIDANQFRLGNLSTASSSPKAFAIANGNILIQQVTADPTKVNLIIKPSEQPDLDLPKIEFIIYKSVLKSSLIETDGTIVSSTKNDLAKNIWASHALQVAAFSGNSTEIPPEKPLAKDVLGFAYSSTGTGDDLAADTDSLNKAFFGNKPLFPVKGGDHIGDFDVTGVGVMIIFEKMGFNPSFKIAREIDSLISFNPLSSSATSAQKFERRHEKEVILAFLDSCAFFSLFSSIGLNCFSGSGFTNLKGLALFDTLTNKFLNKRKIYFDFRNEYDDSLNYYGDFNDLIGIALDGFSNYTDVNYYRSDWPILAVDDSEISSSASIKEIKINLPVRGKRVPTIYLKRVFRTDTGIENLPQAEKKFPKISVQDILDGRISVPVGLAIPAFDNQACSNYFQIKYFTNLPDKVENTDFGQLIYKKYFLDNLFPLFDMDIPFQGDSSKSSFKLFYDKGYTDKKLIRGADFTHSVGIAKDDHFYTFVSFPFRYNANPRNIADDKIPLGSLEGAASKPFLTQIAEIVRGIKIVKGEFTLPGGIQKKYLKFVTDSVDNNIDNIGSTYTFQDFTAFALTLAQYNSLKTLKEQSFANKYKVYLGIGEVVVGTDIAGKVFYSFKYQLNGLKEENGEIVSHTEETDIEIYTDQKIVGKPYSRNYEEAVAINQPYDSATSYETYLIGLSAPIKAVVDGFEKQMALVETSLPSSASRIESIVSKYGKDLWNTAKTWVQASPNNADDRPLYWARIKMSVIIKSHTFFIGDLSATSQVLPQSSLENVIRIFEESSRNYKYVSFANAGNKKKILVTGFDPFGLDPNVRQSNPSGCVALTLEDKSTANNLAFIQTMIFPVRYTDFDGINDPSKGSGLGVIEKYIGPWIDMVDIIITISQSLPGDYNLDKFSTVRRGGFPDNMNYERELFSEAISKDGNNNLNWIETTLPSSFLDTQVKYNWTFTDENDIVYNSVGLKPTAGAVLRGGSGGNYLSNEIFYRVARLRFTNKPLLPTGHFHISKIQDDGEDFNGLKTAELLTIVKNAVNRGATEI